MRHAPARPVRACFVRSCCCVVVPEHDLRATPVQCNDKQALSSHFTLHRSHFTSELFSSGFMSSHMSATFFLAIFMSSERGSNFLMHWSYFQFISALLHIRKVEPQMHFTQLAQEYFPLALEETPLTSSYLFVTHLGSSACQRPRP